MPDLVETLRDKLNAKGWALVTAESCTGGMLAVRITDCPGVSSAFDRGFITYSNEAKEDTLKVPHSILEKHGAVSPETAKAMVEGALGASKANLAVSVTGIAGPDGGTPSKPVGLVYIGYGLKGQPPKAAEHQFAGGRPEVRRQSVEAALEHALSLLKE